MTPDQLALFNAEAAVALALLKEITLAADEATAALRRLAEAQRNAL